MEAETIDLTDPLEELLRQTGWTPEYLRERMENILDGNVKKSVSNTKDIREMTLSDLLGDYKCSNLKINRTVEYTETIELSDDEVNEVVPGKNNSEIPEITEVRVIEINDDEDDDNIHNEDNEDDDDEFLEESTVHSNNEKIYDNSAELEKHIDKNLVLKENVNNRLVSIDSTKYKENVLSHSNGRKSENSDKSDDLPEKGITFTLEKNEAKKCIDTDITEKVSVLANNSNNNKTVLMHSEDKASSKVVDEKDLPLVDKRIKKSSENTKKSRNFNIDVITKTVSNFFSCEGKSPSESYTSTLSDLNESDHVNISENNDNCNNDLGFIVSEVHGGINLIDFSMKLTQNDTEETDAAFEDEIVKKLDNDTIQKLQPTKFNDLIISNKDISFNSCFASNTEKVNAKDTSKLNFEQNNDLSIFSDTEKLADQKQDAVSTTMELNKSTNLVNCDIVSSKKTCDIQAIESECSTKSIRKSIEEIIEQLDMACQEDSTENRSNKVEISHNSGRANEIDSSTSLLLKCLDEAIKTCDNNDLPHEDCTEENIEFVRKEASSSSDGQPSVEDPHCALQINLHKMKGGDKYASNKISLTSTVLKASKDSPYLKINDDFPLQEESNKDLMKTVHYKEIKLGNEIETAIDKTVGSNNEKREKSLDDIESLVDNNDYQISESLQIVSLKSLNETHSTNVIHIGDDILKTNTNKKGVNLNKHDIKSTFNEESGRVINCDMKNNNLEANADMQIKNLIDVVDKAPVLENNSPSKQLKENKIVHNETSENNLKAEILFEKHHINTDNKNNSSATELTVGNNSDFINSNDSENTGKSLDKNHKQNNNITKENCIQESEKLILYVGSSKNVHNVDNESCSDNVFLTNDSLVHTRELDKKPKFVIKNNSDEDNNIKNNNEENFEEMRKNLKLQLTSLRNKKKMDILQDVKTKIVSIEFSKKSLLSDSISEDSNSVEPLKKVNTLSWNEPNDKPNENIQPVCKDSIAINFHSSKTPEPDTIIEQQKIKIGVVDNNNFYKNPVLPDTIYQVSNSVQPFKNFTTLSNSEPNEKRRLISEDSVPLLHQSLNIPNSEIITEKQEDEDVSNVFNEIRKIISKQKATSKILMVKSVDNSEGCKLKNGSGKGQENDNMEFEKCKDVNTPVLDTKIENNKDTRTLMLNYLEDKNTPSSSVVNSPFVSNSLDEFLTDAKLNVSYTIPKSGAEEGLRQNYSDEPIMPPVIAEIKEENSGKLIQEIKYKPKTLAEKRRLLEKSKLKEKQRLEKLKKLQEAQKRSYVLYKDKKIFLKAKSMGKCIASIKSSIPMPKKENHEQATLKKPSLLTELYKKTTTPVKYRPGPLSKKYLLQTDYSNWSTELQILPTVILKVIPQLGKPIHPNLLHILPEWDGEVTDNQVEFALSALATKEKQKQNKIFKFVVPYENHQTKILTRKIIPDKPVIKLQHLATKKDHSSTSEEDVAEVIEKLLQYVEIKEIAPTLTKYDEDFTMSDEDPIKTEVPPMDNHVLVKRKSRITKTDRELIRLNCKVVSVEVEENEPERKCFKPYCRLGCICKSLLCERIIGLHCQKLKCIFGCTCPKEKDKIISIAEPTIKVPPGTDLLSMDTVTRIEGEAKRNLAKVEKEFTQTVIHTNDKTIVVGFGNKPRRATKTPKKYTDFFEDEILKDENKELKTEKMIPIRPCFVDLEKWDFSDIIPYCLVHHLHKCHCRGHSIPLPVIPFTNFEKESKSELSSLRKEENLVSAESNANILMNSNDLKKRTVEESFKAIIQKSAAFEQNFNPENDFEETLYSVTGRPLRRKKKLYEADFVFDVNASSSSRKLSETDKDLCDKSQTSYIYERSHCSRTRKVPKRYRRTKSFADCALQCDFANNLTQADLLKAQELENNDNISESDYLKRTIIEERKKFLEETETEIRKKKRKQKIQVRKDEDITVKTTDTIITIPKRVRKGKVKSVFKGEIIVNDSEWLKKLGQNAKQPLEGYARILPWTVLLNGFLLRSINIYCISDMPLRLLLNVGPKLTGEKIMDVETFGHKILAAPLRAKASWILSQSENVREIIKWLLSGTLPSKYQTNCLSFLLVETFPDQFEVRGLCTQGENKQDISKTKTDLPEEGEITDQITEVKHKNMNSKIESLFITKGKFRLRELVEEGFDDDMTDNLYMWVGLPEVYKVGKWRVIFLNNDFAFLYFKNIKYSIKYTDLIKLTEMAKEEALTLILRNVHIRRNYEHALFGLYVTHNYTDRIFIGPYFVNYDDDDIETLRYINESLVSSESFNKMTGNPNYRCGHWIYERTYCHTPTVYMKDTIDLTTDPSSPKVIKSALKDNHQISSKISMPAPLSVNSTPSLSSSESLVCSTQDEHIIYHNGIPIHIKNSKPRSPSEFNRFIITNIPHFGYLGAYQPDNSATLEVSWPFEKKVLQFENADNARDFLQERFNQLLQPVPETFKIQVIVLIHLDLKEHQPINSDFLSGHCICGYFGTYNFREISDEFCKQELNISKEEITKLFARRAHAYIRKKIEELAQIVGINQNDPVNFNVPTILIRAKEEIRLQESIRRQQVSEIQGYEMKAIAKMKKLYEMVKVLPVKERNIESKIINEILQIRPNRIGASEVVEIFDDDDDNSSATPKIESVSVIYHVESDDTNTPARPTKKSLKRKQVYEKKDHNRKVAKVAPFTSVPYMGPSDSVSSLKSHDKKPEATAVKNILPHESKHNIVIVRPHQTSVQPTLTISEDTESVTVNEDPETLTIDEDTEMITIINEDMETVTISDDMETVTINKDEDINTKIINKKPVCESENFVDADSVSHFIIEFDDSNPNDANVTEIIVSQPDTVENIDLSMATVIASVPPTTNAIYKNPFTVSIVSPEIQSSFSALKTYSKYTKPVAITPIPAKLDTADLNAEKEECTTVSTSKELTNKIKMGLQKIIKKSEENLLFLNERDK